MTSTKPSNQRGFTLLELLVVMAIIGMLAAYVGPKYFGQLGQSEQKVARAQIEALNRALDAYRLDMGHYPTSTEGLAALNLRPAGAGTRWNGPYLSKPVPSDPWGRAYIYRNPGSAGREIDIQSLGSDGQRGGNGVATDLSN